MPDPLKNCCSMRVRYCKSGTGALCLCASGLLTENGLEFNPANARKVLEILD